MDFEIKINDKLSLKSRREEDAEECFQLVDRNRDYLKKWLPWVDGTLSAEDTKKYIIECREKFEKKETADFGIWYENRWVGSMGFNNINLANERAEIGYWLDAEQQGKGIMTACVEALLRYGFEELKLHRIQIRCAAINEKSKAIPERLGFKLEGTIREDHRIDGKFCDGLIFGLLKSEWMGMK